MNRDITNSIRYLMDEWVPAAVRDSRWFMYPFFYLAYRGKNIAEVMDFKSRVYSYTPEEYDRFYNSLDTISRNRLTDLNQPSLEYILNHIDPKAHSLVDVGSGNGYLLKQIHKKFPRLKLTGFDIKEGVAQPEYSFVKGNIEHMPFEDNAFDVVTCCHTVEHLLKLDACINELVRIARKQVFIVVPCQRYYYYTLDEHVNFFMFKEALTSHIPLKDFTCTKLNGDWVYLGLKKES